MSRFTFTFTTIPEGMEQLAASIALQKILVQAEKDSAEHLKKVMSRIAPDSKASDYLRFSYAYHDHATATAGTWIKWLEDPELIYKLNRANIAGTKVRTDTEPVVTAQWEDALEALQELTRANQSVREASTNYDQLAMAVGQKAKDEKGVKLLVGSYVQISTSRRDVTGWVISGRGNTAHVLPDLWEIRDPLKAELPPQISGSVTVDMLTHYGQKLQEYRLDSTNWIRVVLPAKEGNTRYIASQMWVRLMLQAARTANDLYKDRLEWVTNGGLDAKNRQKKIDDIHKDNAVPPPVRNSYYINDQLKRWYKAALDLADPDKLRNEVITRYVSEVGGPLTPKELDIIAKEPTHIANDLTQIWNEEWKKLINPPKAKAE